MHEHMIERELPRFSLDFTIMEAELRVAVFLLVFFNLVLLAQQQAASISSNERLALLHLRSSLGIRAKFWPIKGDPCLNWRGIDCQNGHVRGINLSGLRRTRTGHLTPSFAVGSLVNLSRLTYLNSSGFSLPGSIPDWFGQKLASLRVLDLRGCSIFGPIPASIGGLSRLNTLYLSDNSITGMIPAAIGQLHALSVLDLSRNLLTGSVPTAFSALVNLTVLDLSSNFLSGTIPDGFGLLSSLRVLNLYNNSISGSVPHQLGNNSQLVELNLGYNSLSGSLPDDLGRLRSLSKLSVGKNELQGTLQHALFSSLAQLSFLDLSWNQFEGNVPNTLWSLSLLQNLDVSGNNLTGEFPQFNASFKAASAKFNFSNNLFYGNLTIDIGRFQFIDLSSNYFEGLLPTNNTSSIIVVNNCIQGISGQRSVADCWQFYADRNLIYSSGNASEPLQPPTVKPGKSRKRLTYIMVGLFGGLGLIVIVVALAILLKRTCERKTTDGRGNGNVRPVAEEKSVSKDYVDFTDLGESFTYEQILKATDNFNDTNFIKHGRSGDLFHGTLEGGYSVVIKRVNIDNAGKESYISELDFFSKAAHTRMVPLMGCCLERDAEKFLVYKYMPNGDLMNSFYRHTSSEDDSLQSLDWITRLKIAIGVAEGLAYLHHECDPPLVHSDVQASSILLEDKYEVRLGSLSQACPQGVDDHQNMITKFLHVQQNSEKGPSGSSSATCTHDVFCFGKVLLELVTGKLGLSKSDDDDSTKEWLESHLPLISLSDKELVTKIVDQSLIIDEDLLEEVWAVAIVAKSCLNRKPSKRPLMRHILRALENPFRVVREENFSSERLRTTSSRRLWSAALFGSWRLSSSESANLSGQTNRESVFGLKQTGRAGSRGSGGNEYPSSHKRSSSEVFPEPFETHDIERQE